MPVAAAAGQQPVQTDGPDDVLTAIKVAKITNWNEPPATEAGSAPVQQGFALLLRGQQHGDDAHWRRLRAHSSDRLELFFFPFFFGPCKRNEAIQGIKINAVITALGATPNQDNGRRLASRMKKQILITLLHLHSS